jgi:hypothetical protein
MFTFCYSENPFHCRETRADSRATIKIDSIIESLAHNKSGYGIRFLPLPLIDSVTESKGSYRPDVATFSDPHVQRMIA